MSSVINNSVSNFNGGAPESRDFVPSILFSVMVSIPHGSADILARANLARSYLAYL